MTFLKKSAAFCAAALVAVTIAGCGGGGGGFANEVPTVGQTGTVAGRLTTPSTARTAGATTLVPFVEAVVACGERESITDSDGKFKITQVPVGVNRCTAVKTGYNLIEFTAVVGSKATTTMPSDIPVYKEGEFLVETYPGSTSAVTGSAVPVYCDVTGGRADKIEIKCDSTMSYSTVATNANSATRSCVYSLPGTFTPSCLVNSTALGTSSKTVTVTGSATISVAASVNPTSGTINDVYTLTCLTSGSTPKNLEGRCSATSSWSAISNGYSMNCSYPAVGIYTPSCRADKSDTIVSSASTVTVSLVTLAVTASITPLTGETVDKFTVTCSANGTPVTIETKCDTADSTWINITPTSGMAGIKDDCLYGTPGTYKPVCRVNGGVTDEYDSTVTVISAIPPRALAFTPTDGATNVLHSGPTFNVQFDSAMAASDSKIPGTQTAVNNLNSQTILTASGFSITIQHVNSGNSLTINAANALSYGTFGWLTTTKTNDTLKFTLKSTSQLKAAGLKYLLSGDTYSITGRTVPNNLYNAKYVLIDTTVMSDKVTPVPTTGTFTTSPDTVAPFVKSFSPANGATGVASNSTKFSVVFSESMLPVSMNTQATLTASGFSISLQRVDTGATLTINAANALNYGTFAWEKAVLNNDTLSFTLKSNAVLNAAGLSTIDPLTLYNITSRTVPTNFFDLNSNALNTSLNISSTGSFTTGP